MTPLSEKILDFNKNLQLPGKIPAGINVMNPFQNDEVYGLCAQFYRTYYNDTNPRYLILGINPGRFGGGTTGIPFTDPKKLAEICSISNDLQKRTELSADFIYAMIDAFGGVQKFYGKYLFSSISPLGFTHNGKNLNYYDHKELEKVIAPFAVSCIKNQLDFGLHTSVCYCLGEGKNYKFLQKLNDQNKFFDQIIAMPHPRFIMQYRRKRMNEYIEHYLGKFSGTLPS